ncbi:MAG: bifunctional oligoribonuclease/PAP phosphatase NrnA [Oscillochloris sp.]|nr:bifunctional oligoribonuclease/PAP phosphatase NrnA [Oscillochloris sp.]
MSLMRPEFTPADDRIRTAGVVLVMAHASPDGDCIGCALAMRHVLRSLGKQAYAYCADRPRPELAFLPGVDDLLDNHQLAHLLDSHHRLDLVIVVDTGDLRLLGDFYAQHSDRFDDIPLLSFDHHKSNTRFGDHNVIIDTYGSCAEVLIDFFQACNYPLEPDSATCLLTGLITDTNHFRIPDTTAHSFLSAAALVDHGARLSEINENLMVLDEVPVARLKARVLSGMRTDFADQLAWLAIEDDELGHAVRSEDKLTSGLAGYLRSLHGVQIGVVMLAQHDRSVKISFRGRAGTNVVAVANELGGGGHVTAAGARVEGMTLEATVRYVVTRLGEVNAELFAKARP